MNSLQIEYFMAAARNLSFSDTAREIYVSQPAISKQISLLERELGATLFDRGYRTLKLTKIGQEYYEFFLRVTTEYDDLQRNISESNLNEKAMLRIGSIAGITVDALANAIRNYSENHPDNSFRLESDSFLTLLKRFDEGKIDILIALRPEIERHPNIAWRTIDLSRPNLVMSRDNPCAKGDKINFASLQEETFLSISPEHSPFAMKLIRDFCRKYGFAPRKVEYFSSTESIRLSVESNMGVAFMHGSLLNRSEKVKCYYPELIVPVVAAWSRTTSNRQIDIFIQELLKHVEKDVST
jgi:DNA-binding transcriptional LysR family regulator